MGKEGFLSSIRSKVGGFFSFQSEPKTDDNKEIIEEIIEGENKEEVESSPPLPTVETISKSEDNSAKPLPVQVDKSNVADVTQEQKEESSGSLPDAASKDEIESFQERKGDNENVTKIDTEEESKYTEEASVKVQNEEKEPAQ